MSGEDSPLIRSPRNAAQNSTENQSTWARRRARGRIYLESKQKHYIILSLVTLDVIAILLDILVSLVTCDIGKLDEPWVEEVQEATKISGLVISCLFLVELVLSVWAFGIRFFYSWFHCFDAVVIVISFVIDIMAHGLVEEIASLVIILRLWRLVKIVEEMSVASSERMEELEMRLERLEEEKTGLLARLDAREAGDEGRP